MPGQSAVHFCDDGGKLLTTPEGVITRSESCNAIFWRRHVSVLHVLRFREVHSTLRVTPAMEAGVRFAPLIGMSRDFRKLHVFQLADELLLRVYRISSFPREERFPLQAQVRRAALSTSANIVEGSARRTTREFLNFINIAAGSATETRYLLDVSVASATSQCKVRQIS